LRYSFFVLRFSLIVAMLQLAHGAQPREFSVVESTIAEMQAAMRQRRITSRGIVQQYLDRIAKYEDRLNAIITLNPRALDEADARDRERAQGKVRGPLHGIPIALKDNIHTIDMPTTGGALAFKGFVPPYEATLTKHLREAGAIIIAKTNMTELANWVGSGMPGNYSAVAGHGLNPYDPRTDPRQGSNDGRSALGAGGSSSGAGTAVSFWAANVGTETTGSILTPANQTMLAAIKPTVGRVSRYGIIPITADQDTAGPMARSVADAAVLFGVLEGEAPDPLDESTKACVRVPGRDYTRFLNSRGLAGARIGVPRGYQAAPAESARLTEAIDVLKRHGAVVVDPATLPVEPPANCASAEAAKGKDEDCSVVSKFGMKRDFNLWLASLGPSAPVKTLTELRKWNLAHQDAGSMKYGQARLDISDEMDLVADRARYLTDREKDVRVSGTEGIDAVLRRHRLDALMFLPNAGVSIAAKAGYPTVIVPFGFVPNAPARPFPEGFAAKPSPLGIRFTGTACTEPRLIEIAYAFEQATKRRVPPPDFP
jgi:amidase